MNNNRLIFSQLLDYFPRYEFDKIVAKHNGNKGIRKFTCLDQFLCMMFAQLTCRESLRDTETCLRALKSKLYHAGFRGNIAKSTLADANEKRPSIIFEELAQILIAKARSLYINDSFAVELSHTVYALDSTTIGLCLELFPWAKFRKKKSGIKLHTLLDLRGNIPTTIIITSGKISDVKILDAIIIEVGSIYIMDRGYVDFKRLYRFEQEKAYFITRAKIGMLFRRVTSYTVDKSTGVMCDQTIFLTGSKSQKDCPVYLRRIKYHDKNNGKVLIFITNNFSLPAETIAALYQQRWQVELFFKWIKQHLRIKSFFGTTENSVKTQIWIAISTYLLISIAKKHLCINASLYQIQQILSVTAFEKMPMYQLLTEKYQPSKNAEQSNILDLFDI